MIICGTGHRPNKLGGYDGKIHERLIVLARDWLLITKPDHVISGGALGWDQALAWAAYFTGTPYTMALPFPGFEDRWPIGSKNQLYSLMHNAKDTVFVCEAPYAGWKMQERNKWMVDKADQVLALWDGSAGGTGNCVAYANKKNKPIVNLWDLWSKDV